MPNLTCKKGPVSVFDPRCFQLYATFNVNMGQQRSYVHWKTVTPSAEPRIYHVFKKKLLKGDLYFCKWQCDIMPKQTR